MIELIRQDGHTSRLLSSSSESFREGTLVQVAKEKVGNKIINSSQGLHDLSE